MEGALDNIIGTNPLRCKGVLSKVSQTTGILRVTVGRRLFKLVGTTPLKYAAYEILLYAGVVPI